MRRDEHRDAFQEVAVFFARAVDFGFSKTPEETIEKWGRDRILSDMVWTIRHYRPDVVILRFSGTPADVDVFTCYDPFTIVTLMQLEDSGFCAKGEGGAYAASGAVPFNTHGGLLSHAYVLGIAHVVEVVRQLRGEASNQVEGAEVGTYGGYTGPQASTLILRKAH